LVSSRRQGPRDIINKIHRETLKALEAPSVRERLMALGMDRLVMSPVEFDSYVRREILLDAALVKTIGLKPE